MMLASAPGTDIAIIAIVMPMLVAIAWVIMYQWRRARTAAYDARLKQLMIERGMSAGEIERVLQATSSPEDDEQPQRRGNIEIGCGLETDCCAGDPRMKRG